MEIGYRFHVRFSVWVSLLFIFSACKKDGPKPDYPAGSDEYINDWILDSMQVYYYWNSILPKSPDFFQL